MHIKTKNHSQNIAMEQTSQNEDQTQEKIWNRLVSSPSQIWKSKISWRITLAVFVTILIVQAGILTVTAQSYEADRLAELREAGRSAIVPLIDPTISSLLESPIDAKDANRLISTTKITALSVYSTDLNYLKNYGDTTVTTLSSLEDAYQTYRSMDGTAYEVVFRPNHLGRPFYIVARLDAAHVNEEVYRYIQETVTIVLLMSAFVTSVLMLALGHWLLEPILFLRSNLLRATENPEDPRIPDNQYDTNDEIGSAIEAAHDLIAQNADNLKRIKSAAQDQIYKLAYYDTLTGLPNRTQFLEKLYEKTQQRSEADKSKRLVVMALDLDHFKDINDSMGHSVGDAILRSIGKRVKSALPDSAMVARSGEDEFTVMMPLGDDPNHAQNLAERVAAAIRTEPFKVFNEDFQIRSSIGYAIFPDDGIDPDLVLKNADIALNRAKEEGRDNIKAYTKDFDIAVQQRFQLLRDLRTALDENQLSLHFQPQFDLNNGTVIGAEALLRWWKPDNSKEGGHFISPAEFIPIAEQSGLIVPIGEWVLRQAAEACQGWHKDGYKNIRIAVNVSAAQFHQGNLPRLVKEVLDATQIDSRYLELEVTESVFMDDINHTIRVLKELNSYGIELAIDDFGTGYSSLSYLRQFPIDRLKIDQSFIRNAITNPDDASIARTIIGLGRSLNLKVIAEGVEAKEHEDFLKSEGCEEVQGFRYSRAIPNDQFTQFLKDYPSDLSYFDKKKA